MRQDLFVLLAIKVSSLLSQNMTNGVCDVRPCILLVYLFSHRYLVKYGFKKIKERKKKKEKKSDANSPLTAIKGRPIGIEIHPVANPPTRTAG